MEVLKSHKGYKFRVLRAAFFLHGRDPQVGELIEINIPGMAEDFCSRGLVEPADCPEIGVYIALQPFTLSGLKKKFEAQKLQKVELRKEDAVKLMFRRIVIPADPIQWRPFGLKLKKLELIEISQNQKEKRRLLSSLL